MNDVNNILGDADDILQTNSNAPGIIARIASITIGGQIYGTSGGAPDSFGIQAEQIGSITVNKVKLALTTAKDDFTLAFTGDVRVREL